MSADPAADPMLWCGEGGGVLGGAIMEVKVLKVLTGSALRITHGTAWNVGKAFAWDTATSSCKLSSRKTRTQLTACCMLFSELCTCCLYYIQNPLHALATYMYVSHAVQPYLACMTGSSRAVTSAAY